MRRKYVLKGLGVLICLIGAFLMGWGGPIFGENHTGVATVLGITGIGIITSSRRLMT